MAEPRGGLGSFSAERQKLLRLLLKDRGVQSPPARAGIPRRPRPGPVAPASFAQQRLWILDRLEPGSPAYNIPVAVDLGGALDAAALLAAVREIERRHEALRTTFEEREGEPVQRIHPEPIEARSVVDLAGLPAEEAAAEAARIRAEEAVRPFDLERGPLLRTLLVRRGERDHLFLLTFHHIVSDGWSTGVFVRELTALYAALAAGRPPALPALPIQYADFAEWQRGWLSGETLEEQLGYWRERLAGLPPALDLPLDRPRPLLAAHRGGRRAFQFDPVFTAALRDLGRREEATPFMVLLAGWSALLGRISGQADLAVGSPIAGRNRQEIEGLIGFFVNTLTLRSDLAGDPSFLELLGRVRAATRGAFAHQDLPFERLVEELQPERELGRNPLFQVAFAFQNAPVFTVEVAGLTLRTLPAETGAAKFDLALDVWEVEDSLAGELEHSAELFDPTTIDRLSGYFSTLFTVAVANPSLRLSELPLLGEAERHQLLEEWNDTETGRDRGLSVPDLFEEQARARPDELAAVFESGPSLSYRELEERSGRLAGRLHELGVAPEEVVAFWAERTPGMLAALVGIARAGAACLPLDPSHPDERLALQLCEAGVRLAVAADPASAERLERMGGGSVRILREDAGEEAIIRLFLQWVSRIDPDCALSVMYTSGSTGRPKGVVVPHRGVVRLVRGGGPARIEAGETVLQIAPISFDASTFEIWGALANGGRLVFPAPGPPTLDGIARLLEEQRVDVLHLTAGLFHAMVEERLEALRGLKRLLTGGDALSAGHVRRAARELPGCEVVCCYGPTEGTTFTSCRAGEGRGGGPFAPLGRPIADTQVYLLDAHLRPVPIGVVGELCVGGEGLARGYLSQPDRTAERFIPFPSGRLYRTGDRARQQADGTLEFLGRFDGQVKIRGFRVEPGEIEAAIESHPAVARAVVLALGRGEGARLAAFAVPRGGDRPAPAALRAYLQQRLPEPMLPGTIEVLDELPLTSNAKVDRRALAVRAESAPVSGPAADDRPVSPAEERVAAVWAEVLGRERVGPREDFFALGGHSLLAIRLLSRLRDAFRVEIPLRALFESPTVEGIAARLGAAAGAALPPVTPASREGALPQSHAQQRLWFIDQLEPGTSLYSVPFDIRLEGELDVPALEAAFDALIARHEVLRTTYGPPRGEDGVPVQIVHPPAPYRLPVADLSALPEPVRETEAARLTEEEFAFPFDLAAGPVFRARLVRIGQADHRLLTTTHHIACDAGSLAVVWGEMAALYAAAASGRSAVLPPLPVQYADYAVWQRRRLAGEAFESQLRYWKERLGDEPPALELPADHPRPALQSHTGGTWPVAIRPETDAPLRALARREGATPFLLGLALFQALLRRDSGQWDVSVGTPVSGRGRAELEGVVGFFLNTLVLRIDLAGDPTLRGLLRRVRDLALEAFAQGELPFDRLVDELRPQRSLSRSPLFQVLFVLLHSGGGAPASPLAELPPGLDVSFFLPAQTTAKFDLTLSLFSGDEPGMTGAFEYAADLFDASTLARLADRLAILAAGLAADPDRPLSAHPVLAEAERHQLLVEHNDTAADFGEDGGVHRLFERQAARTPDAPAAVFAGESLSYAELDRRAGRLAAALRARGVGPDVRVGISLERGLDVAVAVLGVLKAGGAYVPIDPAYPQERRAFLLEDAQPALLLDASTLRNLTGEGGGALSRTAGEGRGGGGDALAYVLYTSGSTGRPKGVALPHRAVRNLIEWHRAAIGGGRRTLQYASLSFDVSFHEMLAAWSTGGCVVMIPEALRADLPALADFLVEQGIEKAVMPVVVLRELAEEYARRDRLPPLTELTTTGEALQTTPAMAALLRRLPGCLFQNHYGPTESHVVTSHTLDPDPARWASHPPIGRPVANARLRLLDADLRPVPLGVVGELGIGGVPLARGYLGRPGLTAERFVPDPLAGEAQEPGARLYRTGDRARYRADGEIDFLGRFDHQVKVRGFRVEPEEIEAVLAGHPAVRQAVVLAREDRPGDRRLVAYAVPRDPATVTSALLRGYLRERLPDYMVPSHLVLLDELPLTPNRKVDRRALPAPDQEDRETTAFPRTPVEEVLAGIWSEVLETGARIGAHDDFFSLGGHSLLATRVVSRVRDAFRVELPLRALFEEPTVAGLARRVEAERGAGRLPQLPPVTSAGERGRRELPLSFAQQRLWFLDRLVPDNPFYNMPLAVGLAGRLGVEALREAFAALVRRHETLRTSFPERSGRPVQAVAEAGEADVPLVDLAGLPEAWRDLEARRLTADEASRPFDLRRGPLVRARLIRLAAEEHALLVTLHHIISDGWSLGVLHTELAALYGAFAQSRPSPLPDLPVQYGDFAVWQREWLRGAALESLLGYWRKRLAGLPESLTLPLDRPRPAVESFRGHSLGFALPADLVRPLAALTRQLGATPSMTLLAAFQALLGRLADTADVPVGVAIANRTRREVEGLIGFFVNTLVLRGDLGGPGGFAALAARTREASLDAHAHQDLPFERLVEEIQPERDLGRNPLIQVMFGYQNFPRPAARVSGLTLVPPPEEGADSGASKFDLTLFLYEQGEGLAVVLEYSSDLFDEPTVRRFAGGFEALLRGAIEAPERPLGLLSLLSEAERHQLVLEWNATAAAYPREARIPELFARQVRRNPRAAAVVYGERSLTYEELDRRSEELAGRLAEAGVGLESRVGLCVERSPELIVGMLGILKAGGTYVPLDPEYPAERLAFLIEDAGLTALVATEAAAANLPEHGIPVLFFQGGAEAPSPAKRGRAGEGASLAYVIYTSGSTGRPKGVEVPHRAVARLVLGTDYLQLGPTDRVAQAATASFDAATFEVWGPLLNGGCVVGIPKETALDPTALEEALRRSEVTALFVTTALFHQVARDRPAAFSTLEALLFGGEAIDPRRVREVLAAGPPARLLHVYGPTESTTFATAFRVERVEEGAATVAIGRPIANTRLHVLDILHQPVPAGVPGELCLGGDGLARGYAGQPALTAAKWIPDPLGGPGERLYRTGDRVRLRPDGAVEFLGRLDAQVKVRGFRIEPGEIEARLAEHPGVREAVVLPVEVEGDRRLAAYLVREPGWSPLAEEARPEQVAQWEGVFDDIYARAHRPEAPASDPEFNVVGWIDTYTGAPLPPGEMAEWLEDTVGRILDLRPRRVLEIGCGTGLILFRVAPRVERYVGLDISAQVLGEVEAHLATLDPRPPVELLQRRADQLDEFEPGSFDTVVLNSVVQYFPGPSYLAGVIARAARLLRPGGAIFLGDLRSLPLADAYRATVDLHGAEDDLPARILRHALEYRRRTENEMLVDPRFFTAVREPVPAVSRVVVCPKRGRARNELTAFRYQVVLRIGEEGTQRTGGAAGTEWLDWQAEGMTVERLRLSLSREAGEGREGGRSLGFRNIPNARTAVWCAETRLLTGREGDLATVGELKQQAREVAEASAPVEPQDLWDLARDLPWEVELGWAAQEPDGRFEAVLRPRGTGSEPLASLLPEPAATPGEPLSRYANDPLERRMARQLAAELRAWLGERLPEPMVPSSFVTVAELPLTPNGKVDRRALAARGAGETGARSGRSGGRAYVPPRTPLEGSLAAVWAALLGVEAVGAHDDFFELGGHSLLATQAVSRVRQELGVELPLRELFEHPTVARLAARIEERSREERDAAPPLRPAPRPEDGRLPLSFAQERLWFLHRLDPASPAYNEQAAFRLTGRLDVAALRWSLDEIVRRHESLRTVFDMDEGGAFQAVLAEAALDLPAVDLSRLPGPAAEAEARRLAAEQTFRPFDLSRGPLMRALLFRLGEEDHALVFAFHHIVFDGWSVGVLARELEALYSARAEGRPSPLAPLEIQVPDFAVWQRGWLQGEALARQLDYWRERLAGIEPLELPADRPRPAVFRARGGSRPIALPEGVARAVRDRARREGATPFMVLLAVFQAVLRRWADPGEERPGVPVGSTIANRNRAETEGLIGFFVNVLVLRTDLSGDPGFRELIGRVREVALGAYAHQDLPFERLVEELQPERDLSRNPLFEAGFQVVNVPGTGLALPGLEVGPFPLGERGAKLDVNLSLSESREGIAGLLDYDADRFDRTTAARLLGHFERLLRAALAAPDRRLSELPLLTPEEEHQARVEWNDTRPMGEAPLFLDRFEGHAARDPEAPVLFGEERPLSYGELNRRAEDLAAGLRGRGAGPERVVGIALEASAEAVVAILAVWKAGAAYVPLDPSYPEERLAFYRADSGAEIVMGESPLPDPPPLRGRGRPRPPGQGDLAYVLYTSGSTGEPRGVEITHRGFAHLIDAQIRALRLGPGQRLLQFAALAFDASVAEIGAALGSGAALVLRGPQSRLPGEGMARLLAGQRVTAAVLTPSALAALPVVELPDLATLAVAGEACPPDLPARWAAPGRRLLNLYGPTEATVQATGGEILPGEPPAIGRPIPAARTYVVDARLRALPAGVPGELALAGPGLARGYRGRPALTAGRFVPDPWGEPGGRLYRTGDRVRLLPDGRLDFMGRIDQQVKVRGIRVELGEIESRLLAGPGVRQAAVVQIDDRSVGTRLVAFVAAAAGEGDETGLRQLLRRGLPEGLIPSSFLFLENLPRTPGGKLDRRALARLAPAPGEDRRGYVPPRTPVEEMLAGIWSELLKVERVGAADDFFALSGHSLLATQVANRIRQVFGVDLPLRRLFERTTLAELAREIESAGGRSGAPAGAIEAPIVRVPRDEPLPASFYQELAWQLQGGPVSAEYNMPHTVVLPAGMDRTALRRALTELARRQEALRTTFREEGGELFLHIAPPAEVPLPVVDLAALPETARRATAEALAREDAARPFHLAEGPLFRVLLLDLGADQEAWLLLNLHHILSDGWSMGVMRRELILLYEAFAAGRPSPLADPPVQFADYAAWQRRTFAGEPLEAQLAWWRRRLADPPPHPELPCDRPRLGEPGPAAVVGEVTVPPPLTRALRDLARRSGASLAMVLLGAFEVLTCRQTGARDLLTAATVSGRNRPELAGLIGLFMNTLVLRTDLSGSPTFRELLLRVRETVLDAYRHQDVPYPQLLAALFPGREVSRTLLSRRMFNLIAFPEMPSGKGGFEPAVVPNMEEQAKQDLALDCLDQGATLHCRMICAADLFTAETAAALATGYAGLLAAIADRPDTSIDLL